jgi:hypothetical protein
VGNIRRVTIKLSQLLKKRKFAHCEEDEFIRHLIVQLLNVYFGAFVLVVVGANGKPKSFAQF